MRFNKFVKKFEMEHLTLKQAIKKSEYGKCVIIHDGRVVMIHYDE